MIQDSIGWVATAIFTTSYFFRDHKALRLVQAVAACVWLCYGLAIHSAPVIWSNVIVIAAALYSRARSISQLRAPNVGPAVVPASPLLAGFIKPTNSHQADKDVGSPA